MQLALLFTGHMIDLPERESPRFPPASETAARVRIGAEIDRTGTAQVGRGFASAARGGDILFHEECRRRDLQTEIVLPFGPQEFIKKSVAGAEGGNWEARFWDLWNRTAEEHRVVLNLPVEDQSFAECNTELLHRAQQFDQVHLIALWDGQGGDGPGGTADMVGKLEKSGDKPAIIAPQQLKH
jgi:hypothetical protein